MSNSDILTRSNFIDELLPKNNGYIIIKFTADWCGPCKKIKPHVDNFLTPDVLEKIHYLEKL